MPSMRCKRRRQAHLFLFRTVMAQLTCMGICIQATKGASGFLLIVSKRGRVMTLGHA